MSKIFKTILLGLYIAIGTFSLSTRAENVTLLLWFEDQETSNTFPRERFDHISTHFPKLPTTQLRTVFIPLNTISHPLDLALQVLEPSDQIQSLVIATHGATDVTSNTTILYRLGSFGPKGMNGYMRKLFTGLKNKWSENLGISLLSCSTACGKPEQFSRRVDGLYRELSILGVKRLRIWGATQDLAFVPQNNYQLAKPDEIKDEILVAKIRTHIFSIAGGLILPAAIYFGWDILYPQTSSPQVMGLMSLLSFSAIRGYFNIRVKKALRLGSDGLLVEVNPDGKKSWAVDASDPRALIPISDDCESALQSF